MSQRTALLVTTALTVFVMVMVIGVGWQVFEKSTNDFKGLQTTAPVQVAGTAPNNNAIAQEQIAQRETAFQELIQQANQRLEQSFKEQQELTKQVQVLQQNQAGERAPVSQQPKFKVTSEQAASIALVTVPGAVLLRPPELISFQETPAYEVTLDRGVVYIDANSGQVLYNSAAIIIVRGSGSGSGSGNSNANNNPNNGKKVEREDHDEDEHKQEDKHEDEHEGEEEHGD